MTAHTARARAWAAASSGGEPAITACVLTTALLLIVRVVAGRLGQGGQGWVGIASLKLHERWPGPALQSASYDAEYITGILWAGDSRLQVCVCVWCVDPPAGVDESSHDAKWGLGDPNLDPDLVSN